MWKTGRYPCRLALPPVTRQGLKGHTSPVTTGGSPVLPGVATAWLWSRRSGCSRGSKRLSGTPQRRAEGKPATRKAGATRSWEAPSPWRRKLGSRVTWCAASASPAHQHPGALGLRCQRRRQTLVPQAPGPMSPAAAALPPGRALTLEDWSPGKYPGLK